ncbi:hypothetical protein BofuT4_P044230.1 [Botrytis cinerea T4]|uniref:Uncharacterized protein n=1 Tax=Botryotinia fuckeliana (strain T4) TaxID=999810 RepID=G2XY68_BOTF4|nr:hypothetical protein BofuT4_P044230.1 [Botrytis cinerea T4]
MAQSRILAGDSALKPISSLVHGVQLFTIPTRSRLPFQKRIEASGFCASLTANLHLEWSTPRQLRATRYTQSTCNKSCHNNRLGREYSSRCQMKKRKRNFGGTRDLGRLFLISSRDVPLPELFCKARQTATVESPVILDLEGYTYRQSRHSFREKLLES